MDTSATPSALAAPKKSPEEEGPEGGIIQEGILADERPAAHAVTDVTDGRASSPALGYLMAGPKKQQIASSSSGSGGSGVTR